MALPNGDLITTPFDPQMAYPSDRRMQVDTLNSRDSISMFIRWEGMPVYVLEDKKIYILQGGRSNEYWKELGTGSGTGGTTFVGQFESADLLPTSGRSAGDYAFVGTGDDFVQYNWDNIAGQWIMAEGQTDMASEFFHIGYKTPLRRPVIFPLFPKDVLVQTSGDFVFAPETAVARFIFVGEVTAIRGIETATADREIKLVNRTGSDIILRDKSSGIPTGSGFDFGGTDYTWVNGSEITLKGSGTYWQLAPNNQIAFSDHLDSVNAQVSVGSDGLEVITGIIDNITKETISIEETNEFVDGTSMDDSKVDGYYYFKARGKYFVRSTFKKNQVINVKDLGAKGDGFDNALVFAELESVLSKIKKRVIFPSISGGYTSSRQLNIPVGCDFIQYSTLHYTGTVFPAIKIGQYGVNNSNRTLRILVNNVTLSDWENDSCVGVELINLYVSLLDIPLSNRFTVGADLVGDSGGFVYNRINLDNFADNKISLRLISKNAGWVNENMFFNGRLRVSSGTHTAKSRYGVIITSNDGTYENNNNNNFYKLSAELNQPNPSIDTVPFVVENGGNNKFVDCRSEGNGNVIGRTLNRSYNNMFEFGYGPNNGTIEDLGTSPTSKLTIRNVWYNNPGIGFDIYDSGDLAKRACEYNATQIYVDSELVCGASTSVNIQKFIGSLSLSEGGIVIPSSRYVGVRVATVTNKVFLISKTLSSGSGRTIIRCYDSAGTLLTGGANAYVKSTLASPPFYSADYGGSYRQGADTTSPFYISLRPEVAYIDVLFSGGSSSITLRGFSIKAFYRTTSIINPFNKKGLYSTIRPTSSNYEVGTIIYNASTTGATGWRHLGSGNWEGFGANPYRAELTTSTNLSLSPTGWLKYNMLADAFVGAPYDSGWIIQEFVGEGDSRGYRTAWNRNDGRVFTQYWSGTAWSEWIELSVSNASITQRGIIEQATDAEIKTGTDTERAVDPKGLKDNYISYSDRTITSGGTIAIAPLAYNVRQETIIFTGTAPITLNGYNSAVSNRNLILVNQTGGTITIPASAGVTVPFAASTTIGDGEVSRFMVYNNLILKEV